MVTKKKDDAKATVTKAAKAKQGELADPNDEPGTTIISDRKIQEIEDLGDALIEAEDAASAAREKVKDANENLVVAMKKRDRTFYSRASWGTVILSEAAPKAKAKHASGSSGDSDEE